MRLKTKEYKEIMQEKGLTLGMICSSTGLSLYSLNWILDNGGFTSNHTLQSLAIAVDVPLEEITRPEPSDSMENGIEFVRDGKTATVQFCQGRYITRIKRLAKKYPDECQIIAENSDGSIFAHIPVEWVYINPKVKMDLTDAERERRAEQLSRNRKYVDSNLCETT